MIRSAFFTSLFAALVGAAYPASTTAQELVWVSELESNPKLIGREVVVEGIFQGHVGTNLDQIKLKNCNVKKIEFRLGPEVDRNFSSNMRWIRLTGKLTLADGKLVMRVSSWSKINTTDEDRFQDVAQTIGATDHRAWMELADRTARLAEFYDDKALRALVREARASGFRAEEAGLRSNQTDELLALAGRAATVGVDAEESRRMRHKALRWQFDRIVESNAKASEWVKLADRIAELLPGANVPLKPADVDAVNKYRAAPIEAYDMTLRIRPMADREFWIEAITRSLRSASEQPSADIEQLAADAERLLPDRPELGRELLKKWAESEAARIESLPPASQVLRLADVFKNKLGDRQRAQEVIRLWLDTRRKRLSAKDADGRVRLAKEYRARLEDNETARTLLLDAVRIESDLPEAAEQLKSLGYVKGPSGWIPSSDPSLHTRPEVTDRSGDRLLKKDMTPAQVKEILAGEPKPEDKIRFTDRDKDGRRIVVEQWTYRGARDLCVSFRINSASDIRVIAINTPSQK